MWPKEIEAILPNNIQSIIKQLSDTDKNSIQEIRIRLLKPLEICFSGKSVYLSNSGITKQSSSAYKVTFDDCRHLMQAISNHSMYAFEEQLRQGYITFAGGHRIGIVGKAVVDQGRIRTIQHLTSFNIRIAKQITNIANKIICYLYDFQQNKPFHTLIVSPPQCGKTTLLKDIIRNFSNGVPTANIPSQKVSVVDERSELAGTVFGVFQADLGPRTDVLDACPKAEGMILLIRSMSPQIIAVDEIGTMADAQAIDEVLHAGVSIITTVHALNLDELTERPIMQEMLKKRIFDRYILLTNSPNVGTIQGIYDKNRLKLSMRSVFVG